MKRSEAKKKLEEISARCQTKEELAAELNSLPAEDVGRLVHEQAKQDHFKLIEEWSLWFANFAEDNQLFNEYKSGTSVRASCLGILRTLSIIWQAYSDGQSRQELQSMSAASEWGAKLADYGNDLARALSQLTEDITNIELEYRAVLIGRQNHIHFINTEGDYIPYTDEEERQAARELGLDSSQKHECETEQLSLPL